MQLKATLFFLLSHQELASVNQFKWKTKEFAPFFSPGCFINTEIKVFHNISGLLASKSARAVTRGFATRHM